MDFEDKDVSESGNIIEGLNWTLHIDSKLKEKGEGDEIIVSYFDTNGDIYRILINKDDLFVKNYLKNDITLLWKYIKNSFKNNNIIFYLYKTNYNFEFSIRELGIILKYPLKKAVRNLVFYTNKTVKYEDPEFVDYQNKKLEDLERQNSKLLNELEYLKKVNTTLFTRLLNENI